MDTAFSDLLRVDPLTGCKNYLGFLETLTDHSLSDYPADGRSRETLDHFRINATEYSAVLFVAINDMRMLNATKGRVYGDSAIRWMGILLREECNREVYRVGGIEFAVLLNLDTREAHSDLIERILERMEREASSFGFPDSAAEIALVTFDRSPTSLDTILLKMGEAMVRVKNSPDLHFMAFDGTDFKVHPQAPERWWEQSSDTDVPFAVRWISIINILQVLEMGKILDETRQEAFTDAISGLPNMKAALLRMEETLQNAITDRKPFSILMMDGDNIRIYNSVNYAAGDEMIRQMSALLKDNLRPNDFVARWRSGDEFLAVLPDTPLEGAAKIGERFRLTVKETSKSWRFPVTISIGIASYPANGENINSLIDKAEYANKRAKEQGKDQVVLAD
jgi:diguanylate cyclase (GGDEF)-like protein